MGQGTGPVGVQFGGSPDGTSSASEQIATITVVSPEDQDAIFHDPSPTDAFAFQEYTIRSQFVFDPQRTQRAVANPTGYLGNKSAITQAAAPTAKLIVEWEATREGDSPNIPSYNVTDPNMVLMLVEINPESVEGTPDGNQRYTITGRYTYAALNYDQTQMGYPVPPYVNANDLDTTPVLENADLEAGIIDAAWADTNLAKNMF